MPLHASNVTGTHARGIHQSIIQKSHPRHATHGWEAKLINFQRGAVALLTARSCLPDDTCANCFCWALTNLIDPMRSK